MVVVMIRFIWRTHGGRADA